MSMFSSLFGAQGKTPAQPQTQTPAQPQTPVAPAGDPVIPQPQNPQVTNNSSPLDTFAKLWEPETQDANKVTAKTNEHLDPQQIMEAASKIDFSRVVTPEMQQAIMTGGDDAVKAFSMAMNAVAQQTYAQSAYASDQMIQLAIQKAEQKFMQHIPEMLKRQQAQVSLRDENPIFSNPAVAPVMALVQNQLAVKFPKATPKELNKMTKDWMLAISDSAKGSPESKGQRQTNSAEDFSSFFQR